MKPGVLTNKLFVVVIALAILSAIGLLFDYFLRSPFQKLSFTTALLLCAAVLLFIFIKKWPFVFFEKRRGPAKAAAADSNPGKQLREDQNGNELAKKIRTGVFDQITNGFVALEPGGQIIFVNKKAAAFLLQSPVDLNAKNIWTIPPFSVGDPLHIACREAVKLTQSISREVYYSAIDTWLETNIHPSPGGLSIFFNDITPQKKADEKIARARRLYYFISHINQMIVRVPDETRLFQDACNIAISAGQFKMAWIGMNGETGNQLMQMANAGQEVPGLIENLAEQQSKDWLLLKETLGQPGYLRCNNIENDPAFQASLKNILHPRFGSCITIPVKRSGEIAGTFNLYTASTDFFDQEEINLLLEAAGDISFTLDVFAKEASRKKAEKAVIESERRYHTLAEINPVGIFHTDAFGSTTYVNPRWCEIAGWACEKAMGNGWVEAVHPADREALEKGWNRATREQNISISEYRFIHADGNIAWVIGQAVPEYDADNRIIGYVGTITDITSRKKTEEEIKKANDRFELIALATNDAVFELDFQTGESWYNKAFRQLFNDNIGAGNIREDVTQWISRLHPDDLEKITKKMETAYLEPSALFAEELRFKKADGHYGIFYDRSFISRDQHGKAVRVIGSMTDITDLKTVEVQLLASEQKYRTLFYNNPMPCWVTYKESSDILDVNDAALNHYGYTRQEFLAMKTSALLPPGVYEQYLIIKGSGVVPAAGNIGVWPHLKKDGTAIEVELKVHDIVYGNQPCRITLANDITEQRKAEAEIKKANERFELIAQATNDVIWDWNLLSDELWWNDKYHSLFGYPKELVNRPVNSWNKRIHPNDAERVLRGIDRAIDSGKSHWQDEYRYLKNNDTIVYIFDRGFILRDDKGVAYRMMGSMLDMTELKKAQDSIVNEKNLSDSIINSLPGIFYLFDKNGKYLRWNKNFETVTMYSPAEIPLLHPTDLFEQDEKGLITHKINNTFAAGEENVQATLVSKTKVKTPYYFTGIFIDYEGSPCLMGVGIDFSERVKAQEKVEQTSRQLRQLAVHLQTIREEERKRIGREIHDELGQQLTAIKMDIAWIDKKIPGETIALKNKLKNVIQLLDDSNRSIRRILIELRSGILEDHGLLEAVQWLGRQFTNNTGITIHFTSSESEIVTTSPVSNCIFRACQEAYTNITRYAHASSVTTALQVIDGAIVVRIEDNGIGFDKTSIQDKKSFGILGMKERVIALGGTFELLSSPGQGTTITLRLPTDTITNH